MSNAPKTVLCIHDLPGFGRAGLSVIVPVLSALGAQAVAVPTAVLSTHTGGLGTPAKLANPGYGPAALEHYRRLGLRFDCIYSGYLADASQAKLVEQAMDLWPDALTVVDPVMGDHGRMYRGLAPEMVPAMYTLCSRASLILPNTTEAALLLGDPMPGVTGEAELHTAQAQAQRLTRICPRVLITGVAAGRGIALRWGRPCHRRKSSAHPHGTQELPWHGGYFWCGAGRAAAAGQCAARRRTGCRRVCSRLPESHP